jgi:hypothetical protein
MNAQRTGGVEHIGVDDEVIVGHVEFSRHILEEAANLRGEVDDVGRCERCECRKALVVAASE